MKKIIQITQAEILKKKLSAYFGKVFFRCIACFNSFRPGFIKADGYRPFLNYILALLIIGLMVWGGDFSGAENQAQAAEISTSQSNIPPDGPTDYANCIQIALKQSPFFTKTSLDIDISGLDESDSRWGMFPTFSVRSQYYLARPSSPFRYPKAYSISFATDNYNPFKSYVNLQIYKIATRIAVLNHMMAIGGGLQQLANGFIQLDALNQIIGYQEELISLARQNLNYFQTRQRSGTVSTLEVQVAAQEVEMSQFEKQKLLSSQKTIREGLVSFLGYAPTDKLNFDLREGRRQVLDNFDPNAATLEQVQANSLGLKILALKKHLQEKNVKLAYTRFLPDLYASISSPDPTSANLGSGIYFAIGLQLPIWDGLKRYHNVSRQKAILKQTEGKYQDVNSELYKNWEKAQNSFKENSNALKLAQGQEELARLKDRQSEIRHRVGGEPFAVLVEGRRGLLEAKKKTAEKKLDLEISTIEVRHQTGDLFNAYIDTNYQKLKEQYGGL
jgi:outer membrane protein TolC